MIKRILPFTASCIVLAASVGCGRSVSDIEEQVDKLSAAAHKTIDEDFEGIISNNPDYCYGEDAIEYSDDLTAKYEVDAQWLIIAENGNIKIFYGDTWKNCAYSAEDHRRNGSTTLSALYYDERKKMEDHKQPGDEAVPETTAPVTSPEKPTEAPTKSPEKPTEAPAAVTNSSNSTKVGAVKLQKGGDTFTVAAWNPDDVPALLEAWEAATGYDANKVHFINMDCGGGDAAEKYDNLFKSGDDLDVFFCEADWALRYINDDTKTAALEDLGFSDDNFKDQFAYTKEIGRATSGRNVGKMVGVSWQTAAGGFAYRSDLAEQYLGVKTPEEMQAKIAGWDNFVAAATTIAEKSGGKVALADSLGGMWQVFSSNRTTPWLVDGVIEIDDSCKVFADYAKTLWNNGGVTHNSQWSDGWIPAGQDGSCMGYFVSTWGFGEQAFFGQASSESYGKWALCEGPNSYFWGGTWIVVNPATDNADEAQSFIFNSAVDQAAMKKYAISKPEYVNNMSAMKEIIDNGENPNEYVTKNLGGQNYFKALYDSACGIDLKGLITPYDATIKYSFIYAVENYYLNGYSWNDTINAFESDIYY